MTAVTGYVLFRLDGQTFATALDDVVEIVRMTGLQRLPGTEPPFAGVLSLRGRPLPVLDARGDAAERGDVVVLDAAGDVFGVAVDAVVAVVPPEELTGDEQPGAALPPYVVGVRRHEDASVLVVDVERLLASTVARRRDVAV